MGHKELFLENKYLIIGSTCCHKIFYFSQLGICILKNVKALGAETKGWFVRASAAFYTMYHIKQLSKEKKYI